MKRAIIFGLIFMMAVVTVNAATVSHSAAQITPGAFAVGNYWFPSGNVGIGTENPGASLHIYKDFASTDTIETSLIIDRRTTETAANGMGTDIYFAIEEEGGTIIDHAGTIGAILTDVSTGIRHGALVFGTRDGSINTWGEGMERMRIDHLGNVGIGTADPSVALDVVGDIAVSGSIDIGYEIVQNSYYQDPWSTGSVEVTCPAGKKVIGGGCRGSRVNYDNCGITRNYPTSDTTWYCYAQSETTSDLTLYAHAICARVS